MTRGNNLNGKDEWEFTRLNIVWVGPVLDRIFWIGIIWVETFRMGIILGGNCPSGSYPGWEMSRWELSWVGIFQVEDILGGNCPSGSYPRWELSKWELSWVGIFIGGSFLGWNCLVGVIWMAIFWVGVFMLPPKDPKAREISCKI